jgi:hypothetical protein
VGLGSDLAVGPPVRAEGPPSYHRTAFLWRRIRLRKRGESGWPPRGHLPSARKHKTLLIVRGLRLSARHSLDRAVIQSTRRGPLVVL